MNYTKLFNHLFEQHGLILLEEEMQEIANICNEMQKEAPEKDLNEMTKQGFIKKWNVAFEDREQQLEFAREMQKDLNSIIAGGQSVSLTENEIAELTYIGIQHLYVGANDQNYLSHGGVMAILERYEEICKSERNSARELFVSFARFAHNYGKGSYATSYEEMYEEWLKKRNK